MKLLIGMNLSPRWVSTLTQSGIEAAHWSTLGEPIAPDSVIMACANRNDYVVLTHDLDFGAILAATRREKPSVVQVRASDVRPEAIRLQDVTALRQMANELDEGALLTVDANRTRVRILPLRSRQ